MTVIGTAGHIDHGKTTLLRALTGIDPDRLPEERRRGMTIDVGYAHLVLDDGDVIDFVDVPGHDRLVGNMLVGAGEIDAALVVVAADDGPRAQTIEHLELLDGLGIGLGVVAVTKAELVDPDRLAAVVEASRDLVDRTRLRGCAVVATAGPTGRGLAELRSELAAVHRTVVRDRLGEAAPAGGRLAVDRVFTITGRGTVVTGTLRGGSIARGAPVAILPGGHTARVREIQARGRSIPAGRVDERTALNIAGVGSDAIHRGDVVTTDPLVASSDDLLTAIRRPATLVASRTATDRWPPSPGSVVRIHLGTAATDARFGRSRREFVAVDAERAIVRLRLAKPLGVSLGDRFVLRRSTPAATIAGGIVIDPEPPVGPSRRRITADLLTELAARVVGGLDPASELLALHGVRPGQGALETRLAADVAAAVSDRAVEAVAAGGADGIALAELRPQLARLLRRLATIAPDTATDLVRDILDRTIADGRIARHGDRVSSPAAVGSRSGRPAIDPESLARLERLLAVATPPPLAAAVIAAACPPAAVSVLEAAGRIVRLDDDLAYATTTFDDLAATAVRLAAQGPVSPAAFRDATGTSRRYVVAVLEELDRRAILRRTPAGHVAGPRAADRLAPVRP